MLVEEFLKVAQMDTPITEEKASESLQFAEGLMQVEQMKAQGDVRRVLIIVPANLNLEYIQRQVRQISKGKPSQLVGGAGENVQTGVDYIIVSSDLFKEDPIKYVKGGIDVVVVVETPSTRNRDPQLKQQILQISGRVKHVIYVVTNPTMPK